jgi:hypothetical protein
MKAALQCICEAKPYSSVLEPGTAAFAIVLWGIRIADTFHRATNFNPIASTKPDSFVRENQRLTRSAKSDALC